MFTGCTLPSFARGAAGSTPTASPARREHVVHEMHGAFDHARAAPWRNAPHLVDRVAPFFVSLARACFSTKAPRDLHFQADGPYRERLGYPRDSQRHQPVRGRTGLPHTTCYEVSVGVLRDGYRARPEKAVHPC
jgi:hypothetical protein